MSHKMKHSLEDAQSGNRCKVILEEMKVRCKYEKDLYIFD